MIEPLYRDFSYFMDKLEQQDKTIYQTELDSQFNEISDYLKNTLKPEIDTIADEAIKGIAENAYALMHNVGDGTTDWQKLDNSALDDFSLDLTKLAQQDQGSLIIINEFGELSTIVSTADHKVYVSKDDALPLWETITNEQVEDGSLTGEQLAELEVENFTEGLFITNVEIGSLQTQHIGHQVITNNKLQDDTITADKLGVFHNLPLSNKITEKHITDGALTPDKIAPNSIPVTFTNNSQLYMDIWGGEFGAITVDGGWRYKQILKSEQLLDDSIGDDLFRQVLLFTSDKPIGDRTEGAKAFFADIPEDFKFQSRHIADKSLDIYSFDDEVQAAFNRL